MSNKYSLSKNIFRHMTVRDVYKRVGRAYWKKMGLVDVIRLKDEEEFFRELGMKIQSGEDPRCKVYEGERYYRLTFK